MIRRHELSDAEWEFVRPLLPVSLRGRKRLDDRRVLNGIVWKFRTGTAWRDVPERYGPWATRHTRFRRWAVDGTFERMLRAALDLTLKRPPRACGVGLPLLKERFVPARLWFEVQVSRQFGVDSLVSHRPMRSIIAM
ncbi:transposase [Streptomyces atroolivaceus]|uniref:transposase n=1 Tax=Streptomyces atroolivaceus TaxID=66869 RepID=UPI003627F773